MKVSERGDRTIVPRLVSALGKTSTSVTAFSSADSNIPTPNMSKSQLNALRQTRVGGGPIMGALNNNRRSAEWESSATS